MITEASLNKQSSEYNKRFLIKRSKLTTEKLFVEFYLPEYQALLDHLRQSPYPLLPLSQIAKRLFDGPFGSDRKVDMYQESGIPYIRVKDVLPGEIACDGLTYISQEKHNDLGRSRVVPGNVLLTIAGRVGTAAVFPENLVEGNITGHIVGIELSDNVNPHYLALFLNSRFGEFQITRLAHRTTRPELNLREVGQILVSHPPRPIQDRIAQVMQQAYIDYKNKFTELQTILNMDPWVYGLLQMKFSVLKPPKFFIASSGQLSHNRWDADYHLPINPEFEDSNYWCSFSEYATIISETFSPINRERTNYYYVGIQNMKNNPHSVEDNADIVDGHGIKGICKRFQRQDILLARLGPSIANRKSAIVPVGVDSGLCSPEFLVIRPKENVDPQYVLWMVKSQLLIDEMRYKTRGATPSRARLYEEDLLRLRVPKATHKQQKEIGEELEKRWTRYEELQNDINQIRKNAEQRVEAMIIGEEFV